MRRALPILFVFTVLCAGASGASAAESERDASLRAGVAACETGATPAERFAVFTAAMPRIKGAERMQMRIDLLQRRPGDARFVRLTVPKFGRWERAEPRVRAFLVDKRVNSLTAPADYRVLVSYRWHAADGSVLRRATRSSKLCRQPDPRPDLVLTQVSATDTDDPQRTLYEVAVGNAGRGAVVASTGVTLTIGDRRLQSKPLPPLGSGESEYLVFEGPRCDGSTRLELTVDADGAVEEAAERNNSLAGPCAATLSRP